MNVTIAFFATLSGLCPLLVGAESPDRPPNIVLILADDLGYGDVGCYNPESKVPTPNLDRLARGGVRFTDAHAAASVCTPSRYSLMTGRMCFRTGYRGGVFTGVGGPSLIEPERITLASMLRKQGYATACVGKWHLGLTFQTSSGAPAFAAGLEDVSPGREREVARVKLVDFSKPITDGPVHRGFDYFFGTACCPTTDWLYAYIENDRVPIPPDHPLDVSVLPKHPYSVDCRRGWAAPGFDPELVDLVFLEKSKAWIEQHIQRAAKQPFFLFHSMQAVHLPSFAAPAFQGKTQAGPHGDFLAEMDHIVGELMKTLDRLGLSENTLVIFSSDNGPETITTVRMRLDFAHDPARPWRGMKRDDWEGGHRVPLIVRWPGRIKPGVSGATVCLSDVISTCAELLGVKLPDTSAEDSVSFLSEMVDSTQAHRKRDYTLHQTISLQMSIRRGPWKYLDHRGSGGNDYSGDLKPFEVGDGAADAPGQVFNLIDDPGETTNLYRQRPQIVTDLKALLERSKAAGRSEAR